MTGYGKAVSDLQKKKITVEIKTLNSKQFDIYIRMPGVYKKMEPEIRSLLSKKLERGKIELNVQVENNDTTVHHKINHNIAKKYYEELKTLSNEINQHGDIDYLSILLKMPEVLSPEIEEIDEKELNIIIEVVKEAALKVNEFRIQEGQALGQDFINRIKFIEDSLKSIDPFEKQRIIYLKERIKNDLTAFIQDVNIDQNRLEQELIYYIEKIDITEEKVRLKKHCEYFLESLHQPVSNGKKLSFISQEIGREINTIGSKANDVNIQKVVVQMKDELEKIKEQLFNIL